MHWLHWNGTTDLYYMLGEPCHLSNMDPKALVTHTRFHLIQQREWVLRRHSSHMPVAHCRYLLSQSCELMEMSGKQTEGLHLFSKVPANIFMPVGSTACQTFHLKRISFLYLLCNSPGNATALISWGAPSQFINDHKWVAGSRLQRECDSTETATMFQPQEFLYLWCVTSRTGKTEM